MKFLGEKRIELEKAPNELDKFVLGFIREDAAHLEEVFKEKINWRKGEEYRRLIESEMA